jgi:hypothetical protein
MEFVPADSHDVYTEGATIGICVSDIDVLMMIGNDTA